MSITAALGFRASGVEAGIKPGRTDLALVVSDRPCAAAGVFTTNLAKAAPVVLTARHLKKGRARAIVVNAGCANAATGARGMRAAERTADAVAKALGCDRTEVAVASTGVIGVQLPIEKVVSSIPRAISSLALDGGPAAARAILTTDTKPKESMRTFRAAGRLVTLGGMAKGAGMIAPDLAALPHATMLAFFTTDAAVPVALLRRALGDAVGTTFNRITIDSDTSTNDTALILANGASGVKIGASGATHRKFMDALRAVCRDLALMMARDGEGVKRICEIVVKGAQRQADALRIARTIADSPLCKTALHGGDPNWGRVLAAAGRAGVPFDIDRVEIRIGDLLVCRRGTAVDYEENFAHVEMIKDPGLITVDLHSGKARDSVWMCDLTKDYVEINAHYRS